MGHDVAIFAFYGLEGTKIDWGDIPIFPNNPRDWGTTDAKMYYDYFKADFLISLVDIWVLREGGMGQGQNAEIKWCPIVPIDHEPVPPATLKAIIESPNIFKVLCEARFGQEQLREHHIDAGYISHPTNTDIFAPRQENRDYWRKVYNWENKFVIGTVATNHDERKNWNVSLQAFKIFAEHHPGEAIYYMHTNPLDERGINLNALRAELGIGEITHCPKRIEFNIGIDKATLSNAYNSMDVFLLPSKGEGFGVPIIEAQSCGVPVIIPRFTAMRELMGGGWFIENLRYFWSKQNSWAADCNVEEVVELLEKAYQAKKDGSIIKMQQKARAKALEYSEPLVFEKYWKPELENIAYRLKNPQQFKGVNTYEMYYKRRAAEEAEKEAAWRDHPQLLVNQAGMWFEQNRNEICLRILNGRCQYKKVLAVGGARSTEGQFLSQIGARELVRSDLIPNEVEGIMAANVEDLPFDSRSFDMVICRDVLEHVQDADKAMKNIIKVLRNQGELLVTVPNALEWAIDGMEHVRGWTPQQFIDFLGTAGFEILDKRGNVPNVLFKHDNSLFGNPKLLPEFQKMAEGFDENPLSYHTGTQLFVLARKKK